ncbi:MAG: LPS export ABC transporter periplasmic protein LptC [Chitinophagaceae bacterium]
MTNSFPFFLKKFTRTILPGFFFLLLMASCSNSKQEIDEVMSKASLGEERGKDVTILYSRGGHVSTRLFAHTFIRALSANPPYTEMRDGLNVEFYDDSLHIKNTLTAGYARWYELENNILIRDSVKIVNDRGEELQTSELVWNQKIQKFFTEKPVRIITKTQTLNGTGMEASQDFSTYRIYNLTGQVKVEKSQMPGG